MTIYGYARVSTDGQTPESQLRALTRAIAERNTPPPQPQTPEAKIRATYGVNAMPEMSVAVFKAALRRHGFRVSGIRIVDMSGKCPGFSTTSSSSAHHRWTSTGIFECVSTLTVSLPRTIAEMPRRPCEAMTIRSQPFDTAVSMIAW
jgi:hypothetical protein